MIPAPRISDGRLQVVSAEQAAFLGRACDGLPSLRSEVEDLLKADLACGDFLELPPS
jgi:hypothetical protein